MAGFVDVMVIDPPWPHTAAVQKGHTSKQMVAKNEWDYDVLSYEQIQELLENDVLPMASPGHSIFMWAIERSLYEAESMMYRLDYKLHCRMVWDKRTGLAPAFTVRFTHEHLLWFFKSPMPKMEPSMAGKMATVQQWKNPPQHSRKPTEAYDMIRAFYPNHVLMDVFSREEREGWLQWGNECGKFNGGVK